MVAVTRVGVFCHICDELLPAVTTLESVNLGSDRLCHACHAKRTSLVCDSWRLSRRSEHLSLQNEHNLCVFVLSVVTTIYTV